MATRGTAAVLKAFGLTVKEVIKVNEGRPNIADIIRSKDVQLIINTPVGKLAHIDDKIIRQSALLYKVFTITTISAATAMVVAVEKVQHQKLTVKSIQEYYTEA